MGFDKLADDLDRTKPVGKWKFDEEVTKVFDNMLERSIPQYQVMRKAVTNISNVFLREPPQKFSNVIDLGCSRGDAIASLVEIHNTNQFLGIEISPPMVKEARKRFAHDNNVNIMQADLREFKELPRKNVAVVLSILTLQFIPIEYRQRIIQMIYDSLNPGGAFIFVEKVLGSSANLNDIFVSKYYDMKSANGYSEEDIERKRLSLEGVLVPTTAKWNEDLLMQAGFREVDCFWRYLNFAGWVALK